MSDADREPLSRPGAVAGPRAMALAVVMLSGSPLMALVFSAIAPILPSLASHFGSLGGAMLAQWVMTIPALGLMLGGPFGGYLIDRLSVRWVVVVSLGIFALAGSAGLYADNLTILLASRFALGLSGSCAATAANWLIGARYDEPHRRRILGAQNAVSGVTAMSAVLVSGWVAASAGWRMPFAIYLISLPVLACAFFAVPEFSPARRQSPNADDRPNGPSALSALWPHYLTVAAIAGLMMMPATQVPFVLAANGIEDTVVQSRVIASSAFLSILTAALFPFIRSHVGEHRTVLLILGFYAAGTGGLAVSRDALTTALGCVFLGSATGLFTPHFTNLIIRRTEPAIRGRAIGLMFGAIFLSEFLSPLVVLPLRRLFGVHGGFLPLSGSLALALVLTLLWPRVKRPSPQPGLIKT